MSKLDTLFSKIDEVSEAISAVVLNHKVIRAESYKLNKSDCQSFDIHLTTCSLSLDGVLFAKSGFSHRIDPAYYARKINGKRFTKIEYANYATDSGEVRSSFTFHFKRFFCKKSSVTIHMDSDSIVSLNGVNLDMKDIGFLSME